MAITNMSDAVLNLDDSGGTPRDISGQANKVSLTTTITNGKYFTFGSRHNRVNYGGASTSGSLTILESPDSNQAHQLLRDIAQAVTTPSRRTLTIDTPNSGSGSLRYTGEAVFSKIDLTSKESGKGDPPALSADFDYDGAPIISVLA